MSSLLFRDPAPLTVQRNPQQQYRLFGGKVGLLGHVVLGTHAEFLRYEYMKNSGSDTNLVSINNTPRV